MKNVMGIILGGGKGSRLFPLTKIRSKPAVPLGGRYRLIDIPISNCINSDVTKIFVITQYNSESLNRHVTQTYRFGYFREGFVDILAAEQTPDSANWFQGTADAVRRCLRHLLSYKVDYFLILSGDQLYRMDYAKVLDMHQEKEADLTVCVIPVSRPQAPRFGILKMDAQGRLSEFCEKPQDESVIDQLAVDVEAWKDHGVTPDRPYMASMGIYVFCRKALEEMLEDESRTDFGKHIIPSALANYAVYGFPFNGYWEDIGTIRAFYEANLELAHEKPRFTFFDTELPIFTHPRFLPSSRIRGCRLDDCVVAEGCSIYNSTISGSVIGIRSVIRDAQLEDVLMMGADFYDTEPESMPIRTGIGKGTVIRRAIIDKNARIGRDVRILNPQDLQEYDGENYHIRDGIVVIPKNGEIPDGAEI